MKTIHVVVSLLVIFVAQQASADTGPACTPLPEAALTARQVKIRAAYRALKDALVLAVDGNGALKLGDADRYGPLAEEYHHGIDADGPRLSSGVAVYRDRHALNALIRRLKSLPNPSHPTTQELIAKAHAFREVNYPLALHFECLHTRRVAAAASEKRNDCVAQPSSPSIVPAGPVLVPDAAVDGKNSSQPEASGPNQCIAPSPPVSDASAPHDSPAAAVVDDESLTSHGSQPVAPQQPAQ